MASDLNFQPSTKTHIFHLKRNKSPSNSANNYGNHYWNPLAFQDTYYEKDSDKLLAHSNIDKMEDFDINSQSGSYTYLEKKGTFESGEKGVVGTVNHPSHPTNVPSPLSGLPGFSHLGWGHWFTPRDLETATNKFSKDNVIGEGGYGIVYRGKLINGTEVAVKKLLNNLGQAEKEFQVEVEAIGHVRHKNLVRLLGYCIEGTHSTGNKKGKDEFLM